MDVRTGHDGERGTRVWCGHGQEGGVALRPDEENFGRGSQKGTNLGGVERVGPGSGLVRQGTSYKCRLGGRVHWVGLGLAVGGLGSGKGVDGLIAGVRGRGVHGGAVCGGCVVVLLGGSVH